MNDCACCGCPVYGDDTCDSCLYGDCDPAVTWHCGCDEVCDGSCEVQECRD